jgi:hypothetical protein
VLITDLLLLEDSLKTKSKKNWLKEKPRDISLFSALKISACAPSKKRKKKELLPIHDPSTLSDPSPPPSRVPFFPLLLPLPSCLVLTLQISSYRLHRASSIACPTAPAVARIPSPHPPRPSTPPDKRVGAIAIAFSSSSSSRPCGLLPVTNLWPSGFEV